MDINAFRDLKTEALYMLGGFAIKPGSNVRETSSASHHVGDLNGSKGMSVFGRERKGGEAWRWD